MAIKQIKNDKNIKKNKDGIYEFEHVLVQELGQSNVNAIIDSNRFEKEQSQALLDNFDEMVADTKKQTLEMLTVEKEKSIKFLEGITDENKVELALEHFEKIIGVHKELVDNFDEHIEEQYKQIDQMFEPHKIDAGRKLEMSTKTLQLWEKHYDESLNEQVKKPEQKGVV